MSDDVKYIIEYHQSICEEYRKDEDIMQLYLNEFNNENCQINEVLIQNCCERDQAERQAEYNPNLSLEPLQRLADGSYHSSDEDLIHSSTCSPLRSVATSNPEGTFTNPSKDISLSASTANSGAGLNFFSSPSLSTAMKEEGCRSDTPLTAEINSSGPDQSSFTSRRYMNQRIAQHLIMVRIHLTTMSSWSQLT